MTAAVTIARPYAKAIFDYALESHDIEAWDGILTQLASALMTKEIADFIKNPSVNTPDKITLLTDPSLVGQQPILLKPLQNFIQTLALYKRLNILPEIYQLFQALRADYEKTQIVEITSFAPLTQEELKKLNTVLEKRLGRKLEIQTSVDRTLLGGLIIKAGDLVINGSVRGKLFKLGTFMAA